MRFLVDISRQPETCGDGADRSFGARSHRIIGADEMKSEPGKQPRISAQSLLHREADRLASGLFGRLSEGPRIHRMNVSVVLLEEAVMSPVFRGDLIVYI